MLHSERESEVREMKRAISVGLGVMVLAALAGSAVAGMGPGMMGMNPGMTGISPAVMGMGACPAMAASSTVTPITEEKARGLAQEYADTHLKGYTVDKVLPFAMGHGTAYSVELKGPDSELRVLHVSPFGAVMPFGGPWRRPA
jgi:hypothetical protein